MVKIQVISRSASKCKFGNKTYVTLSLLNSPQLWFTAQDLLNPDKTQVQMRGTNEGWALSLFLTEDLLAISSS